MADEKGRKVRIREFSEEGDSEMVIKLEKNCNVGPNKGVSIFTTIMDDPLCRIRFYPLHVMLVAELLDNGELVGVIRGCIKTVGTALKGRHVNLGCMLGLRVSPNHRRKGIGTKLVESVEEWLIRNGADNTFLATEEKNVASINLFTCRCSYVRLSSLVIYVQPVGVPAEEDSSHDIKIERLPVDEAISFYKNHLQGKEIYPTDIDGILKEKLSMGTWVSYFKDEDWMTNWNRNHHEEDNIFSRSTPGSWAIFSIWNNSEAHKVQIRRPRRRPFNIFHATNKIFSCIKIPNIPDSSLEKPFGFLFLYGLYGAGERLGQLTKALWSFASRLAENVTDCKVIMTELGVSDPFSEHVPQSPSMSTINDLWYLKKGRDPIHDEDDLTGMAPVGNVFVDPRDF